MKVAQILYSGLGGHGSVAFTLAEAAGQRWAHSFAFLGVEPLLDSYRQRCDEAGIAHTYFRAMAGRPWGQWRALHRWLERERPDAIINHSGPAIVPCALHSARRGARFVQVEHTAVALKSRSEIIASRMAMALADAVVMLTPDYARLSRERLGRYLPWRKVHIIPNGIDTRRFRPRTGRRPAGPRIGMAGRFTPGKRQELLVRAVAALNAGRGEPTWTLSLAGDGSERAAVAALAERLAPGTVEFAGVLDEEQLGRWFQTLDVYAHASNGETLSTAVLQAMASGVPIVAVTTPSGMVRPSGARRVRRSAATRIMAPISAAGRSARPG